MKAAYIESTGSADVIRYGDLEAPTPGRGEVLIRVHAVSVNPIDTYIRSGAIAAELPNPFILGCDAAGVVEAIGEGVHHAAVGDRVWCTNQGLLGRQGTFAEKIVISQDWCFPLADAVSFVDAAACALVGVTAHLGLFREADLQGGETILVVGGSGGVGSMVVQMARSAGATVIATAGSDEKCAAVKKLGADIAINYQADSLEDAVKKAAPKGVNVFWETRREPDFDLAVELMAGKGRMVLMAGRDARPSFPVGPFYVKECSLHGFAMFKATASEMRAAAEDINHWLAMGKLKANIGRTFDLSDAAQAHRLQEQATLEGGGGLMGKIVLTVN
ncbi:NADPH:quinone reductase [Rubripirellula reticaptiva]|uniref:Zinc-type alcohol dehydrogenase-like protein n=1 Tax=Rubripirellula reticaptiva TaxID=2528013 RepID=A0A5C6EL57_9BACT|nr:NADPH:quinone reductase [Rubripirellula reticaptiva]TWU47999.1 Zinc-type alcohol dehydrogenase-like protein [Rubripirellula reticaptiva]